MIEYTLYYMVLVSIIHLLLLFSWSVVLGVILVFTYIQLAPFPSKYSVCDRYHSQLLTNICFQEP